MLLAAINWQTFFFALFALVACVFAAAVVFSSNVVRMAFYLVISLGATAGLFFLAGAEFVGAMQLMIYVGGTLVLLIFGVMLTAQERFVSMKTNGAEWVVSLVVGGAFLVLLVSVAFSVDDWSSPNPNQEKLGVVEANSASTVGAGLVGLRVDKLDLEEGDLQAPGMSGYLFPFVIISIHLLVVLIGAAYMARTKRRASA